MVRSIGFRPFNSETEHDSFGRGSASLPRGSFARGLANFERCGPHPRQKGPNVAVSFYLRGPSVIRDMVAANQIDIAIAADEIETNGVEPMPFAETPAIWRYLPDIRWQRSMRCPPPI